MMRTPAVLPLRCPVCAGALRGLPQDVVFCCDQCGVYREVVQERFLERAAKAARPVLPRTGTLLRLPMWAFHVYSLWQWQDPRRASQAQRFPAIGWVYVTAFTLHNAFYFGDPGLIFTQKHVTLDAADPAPILGCARGLEEAKAFIEPHLLTIMDRRVDVTGVELATTIKEVVLWGIPYFDEGQSLYDGILGLEIPAVAVDEIGPLRAWNRGRG